MVNNKNKKARRSARKIKRNYKKEIMDRMTPEQRASIPDDVVNAVVRMRKAAARGNGKTLHLADFLPSRYVKSKEEYEAEHKSTNSEDVDGETVVVQDAEGNSSVVGKDEFLEQYVAEEDVSDCGKITAHDQHLWGDPLNEVFCPGVEDEVAIDVDHNAFAAPEGFLDSMVSEEVDEEDIPKRDYVTTAIDTDEENTVDLEGESEDFDYCDNLEGHEMHFWGDNDQNVCPGAAMTAEKKESTFDQLIDTPVKQCDSKHPHGEHLYVDDTQNAKGFYCPGNQ